MATGEIRGPDLVGVRRRHWGRRRDSHFRVTAPRSIVGFKRLAGRGQDRLDLEKLEVANGELPIDPIPGLDS